MENIEQNSAETALPPQHKVRTSQMILAILFILSVLYSWFVTPILLQKGEATAVLSNNISIFVRILLWGFAICIAKNNSLRIACTILLVTPLILGPLYAFLPNSAPFLYIICLISVLLEAYAFSIFLYCTDESSPTTKWLMLWLSITIIGTCLWQGFEQVEIPSALEHYEVYDKIMSVFHQGSRFYLYWIINVFVILINWNVFRSDLFSGFDKGCSSGLKMPFFFNRYVIGAIIVMVASIFILNIWFHIFVLE